MMAPRSLSLTARSAKKQMVIDDDDVAFLGPLMHERDEAALKLLALLAGAEIRAGIDLGPRRKIAREAS